MKLLILSAALAIVQAVTCGAIGGGSRARAHFCGGDLVLNATQLDVECPEDVCDDAFCCIAPSAKPSFVVEDAKPSEVIVASLGTCGMVTGGSRPARHVCKAPLTFDESKLSAPCEGPCDDATCCTADTKHDCSTTETFSPEKTRYCCITAGIKCPPKTCAFGAGIQSDDGLTCCHVSCGKCGGDGCYARGGEQCCRSAISQMNRPCSHYSAPCSKFGMAPLLPQFPPMFMPPMPSMPTMSFFPPPPMTFQSFPPPAPVQMYQSLGGQFFPPPAPVPFYQSLTPQFPPAFAKAATLTFSQPALPSSPFADPCAPQRRQMPQTTPALPVLYSTPKAAQAAFPLSWC